MVCKNWRMDHTPPRRTIIGAASLLGSGALLAACTRDPSPADSSATQPSAVPQPAGQGVVAMAASELPEGTRASVTLEDPQTGSKPVVLLYRVDAQQVVAYSNKCTHQGCAVGTDSSAEDFYCPCHGSRYAPADGAVLEGPAPRPLDRYAAAIEGPDIVVYLQS